FFAKGRELARGVAAGRFHSHSHGAPLCCLSSIHRPSGAATAFVNSRCGRFDAPKEERPAAIPLAWKYGAAKRPGRLRGGGSIFAGRIARPDGIQNRRPDDGAGICGKGRTGCERTEEYLYR